MIMDADIHILFKNGHCKARLYPFAGVAEYNYIRPRLKTAATTTLVTKLI